MPYIMTQDEKHVIDAGKVYRLGLFPGDNAILLRALRDDTQRPITVGQYIEADDPKAILLDAMNTLGQGQNWYAPLSRRVAPEHVTHDARAKRRGGS